MGTRETTKDLQSILEQQSSIDAGLHTEKDVIRYINRICVSLEEVGFVPPSTFTIGRLLKAIEEEVLPALLLSEDGDKKPGFLSRAVGAVKGAVQRGVTRASTKLRQHHSTKASAALDTAVSPGTAPHVAAKAAKAYTKHYVKAAALSQRLAPAKHAELTKKKATAGDPAHGSAEDAKLNLGRAQSREKELSYHKRMAPHQVQTAADVRAAEARRNAKTIPGKPEFTKHDHPLSNSDATNAGVRSAHVSTNDTEV